MNNPPLVLVTGGAGFLGQAVVRRCLARGYKVRVLGRTPMTGELAAKVAFIRGDIADRTTVDSA
jgi:nucleoside-diphosphate-sugar epimerase